MLQAIISYHPTRDKRVIEMLVTGTNSRCAITRFAVDYWRIATLYLAIKYLPWPVLPRSQQLYVLFGLWLGGFSIDGGIPFPLPLHERHF